MLTLRIPRGLVAGSVLAVAAACGGGSDSPTAPTPPPQPVQGVKAVAGGGVTDTVLSAPLQALVVEVRGTGGTLAKGVTVRFTVQAPADTTRRYEQTAYVCGLAATTCGPTGATGPYIPYSPTSANVSTDTTDATGRAKALLRLGTVAGPTYVIVTVPELGMKDSVPFTVTPGAPRYVAFSTRDVPLKVNGQAGLRASVTDAYRNPRADAVTYSLGTPSGGAAGVATLSGATVSGADVGSVYAYARAGAGVDSALVRVIPPGRLLVWQSLVTSGAVHLFNTDGTGARTLESGVASDYGAFPRFSPSGTVLAFHSGSAQFGGVPDHVVIMDSIGANRRRVDLPSGVVAMTQARPLANGNVLFVGRQPYPTGVYSATQPSAVYSIGTDGTVTTVAALPNASTAYGAAEISPDGARVAYVALDPNNYGAVVGLQVLTLATGQSTLVDVAGRSPAWSPAGDRLAYLVGVGYLDGNLAVANADGTNKLSFKSVGTFSPGLAWSPGGAYVLGRVSSYPNGGLRVVRVRDGSNVPLVLPFVGQNGTAAGYGDYFQPDWR